MLSSGVCQGWLKNDFVWIPSFKWVVFLEVKNIVNAQYSIYMSILEKITLIRVILVKFLKIVLIKLYSHKITVAAYEKLKNAIVSQIRS